MIYRLQSALQQCTPLFTTEKSQVPATFTHCKKYNQFQSKNSVDMLWNSRQAAKINNKPRIWGAGCKKSTESDQINEQNHASCLNIQVMLVIVIFPYIFLARTFAQPTPRPRYTHSIHQSVRLGQEEPIDVFTPALMKLLTKKETISGAGIGIFWLRLFPCIQLRTQNKWITTTDKARHTGQNV